MLLGDTLILDDLDCANKYRQEVSSVQLRCEQYQVWVDLVGGGRANKYRQEVSGVQLRCVNSTKYGWI